ncbi:unnamed protein product [Caenorhabditis angaria]|uniref:BED-type domain-containing protein n=1 Tax=Caenorhabditis angaria TaxID=860376 RepID=A0A9P1N4E8_9PELO|nr:unnamed protein product [Caenorhabditis angaria]
MLQEEIAATFDEPAGTSQPVKVKHEPQESLLFDALMSQENTEPQGDVSHIDISLNTVAKSENQKPNWFPSRSSRSIVWDHISWLEATQRAACNYCSAEFQIKGGTSAVLRHLKTIHPQNIDFDPTLEPVKKRKKKTENEHENSVEINDATKSYMDNLLKQFMPDAAEIGDFSGFMGGNEGSVKGNGSNGGQSRADSEIDEVIRSLQQQESTLILPNEIIPQTQANNDQELRKMLGIPEDQPTIVEDIGVSASASPPKNAKFGKFSLSLLSSIKRPEGAGPSGTSNNLKVELGGALGSQQFAGKMEQESRALYNQSLKSTIARENAMTNYYNLKSRYLQLSLEKLEKEMSSSSSSSPK